MKFAVSILYLCFNFFSNTLSATENTYRAAVVAYKPNLTAEQPLDRFYENVGQYLKYVDQAGEQKSDIIVFPEDALTGWYDMITFIDIVEMVSTPVPDPVFKTSPCNATDETYSKALKSFSCSALKNKIYVVVNLVEQLYGEHTKEFIYYNTDVVFDRDGQVIARYRKINLLNEFLFHRGSDRIAFKTDFGVNFGLFTCFDIMFKNPSLTVLEDSTVTDIIFPVAWFSHLPFIQGISIHHGYTTSVGVNMLAAGLHDPSSRNGGTAIYLAGGEISKVYLTGAEGSKILIGDVPKISQRRVPEPCQDINISPEANQEQIEDINGYLTSTEDLVNYTSKTIDMSKNVISDTVCSGGKFCCNFDIIVHSDNPRNYVYKMVAYHGTVELSRLDILGTRVCAVVACKNDNITTCGKRHSTPPTGVTFEKIIVKGEFDSVDAHDQPSTLKHNLKPVNKYSFCREQLSKEKVQVSVSTVQNQNDLLTFGIYGRVFNNDGKPLGVVNIK